MAYDADHPTISETKRMKWYNGDDDKDFSANLSREFLRWDPSRRAGTLKDMADITAADDGVTLRRKSQLMSLRCQLLNLDKELRWAGR